MKYLYEPAIVLRTTALKDADLIVTFLGRELGKTAAVAKSARASKRRFSGGIDLFDCGTFELSGKSGESPLLVLHNITNREVWPGLRSNLRTLSLASFCLEITHEFTAEGDPEGGRLFNPLFHSLRTLSQPADDRRAFSVAAFYGLRLLELSGLNMLDAPLELSGEVRAWFQQMLEGGSPIIAVNETLVAQGFPRLVSFIEHLLGYRLRTNTDAWLRP